MYTSVLIVHTYDEYLEYIMRLLHHILLELGRVTFPSICNHVKITYPEIVHRLIKRTNSYPCRLVGRISCFGGLIIANAAKFHKHFSDLRIA